MMVTWSPGDVDVGVQSLLVQFYPILLSTLLSIGRQQLSRFEAFFALLLSSSLLTIYLVVASICDLFGIHTGLYKRIKSHRLIIRTFGASFLLIWTGLSTAVVMSTSAFEGELCGGGTFVHWFQSIIGLLVTSPVFPRGIAVFPGLAWVIIISWFVCLARR